MKKQIIYAKLIPRLFATSIDLLLLSAILPLIEVPIYKTAHKFLFGDFDLIPLKTPNFPYDNVLTIQEFFSHLQLNNKFNAYIIFLSLIAIIKFSILGGYFVTMWYYKGASFGKILMGMKITDSETFNKPSLNHLIKRYLSLITVPFGIWNVIFNNKKQAIHDKIAKTVVIKN